MGGTQKFDQRTRCYLERFDAILDTMIREMTQVELSDSVSRNFILQMIPHHEAAIEMSENLLRFDPSPALRAIAQGIIREQTKSIGDMEAALCRCSRLENTCQARCQYQRRFGQITQTMFRDMGMARRTDCIDADFMREMIPHHKGAVEMSENALRFPICPELKPILSAIITSQRRGIRQMEQLLADQNKYPDVHS